MRRLSWIVMGLLLVCLLAQPLALLLISGYQQFISPHKGWHCAYAALHGNASCSAYGKEVIARHGVIVGATLLWERFDQCHQAAVALAASSSGKDCDCCGPACREAKRAEEEAARKAREAAQEKARKAKEAAKKALDDAVKAAKEKLKKELEKVGNEGSPTYSIPPSGEIIEKAVAWAEERKKNGDWTALKSCLIFVKRAYTERAGLPKFIVSGSAKEAADQAQRALQEKAGGLYKGTPPRGAWVYYYQRKKDKTADLDGDGHVALSLGAGKIIHANTYTDEHGVEEVRVETIDYMPAYLVYRGWSWPPPAS